jgi:mannose-6-phosphate isomerase-like protein (cupin superfamily)
VRKGDGATNARTGAGFRVIATPEIAGGSGALEIRRVLRPGMGFRAPHLHLDFAERYTVESGVADAWVGHRRIRLAQGDEFVIPQRTTHVNPCNRGMRDLILRVAYEPATDAVVRYLETLAELLEGERDRRGDLPVATALALLDTRDPQTSVPRVPHALQRRVVFPAARSVRQWREERRLRREEDEKLGETGPGYWVDG